MQVSLVQHMHKKYGIQHQAQNRITAPTSQVAKGLGRYHTREWSVKEINDTYYDISGPGKQI